MLPNTLRTPLLALFSLCLLSAPGHASPGEYTIVASGGVCNESTLKFLVDKQNDDIYLERKAANGTVSYLLLENHALRVGYGTDLRSVALEFEVLQPGSWTLFVIDPEDQMTTITTDATELLVHALGRPKATATQGWEYVFHQPTSFDDGDGGALPVPDLVIEPQTGCPEDTSGTNGPNES